MPLSITLNPNVTRFTPGDSPILVSLGEGVGNATSALWESNNGTFVDKYAETTTFIPGNATKLTTITGRRVNRVISDNSSNVVSVSGGLSWGKENTGTDNVWDSFLWLADPLDLTNPSATGMFQATALDLGEKTLVFSNFNQLNPEIVGTKDTAQCYAWHLQRTGLAIPRHLGTPLANPIPYTIGSVFKLEVTLQMVNYYVDGVWVASAPRDNSISALRPTYTFKNFNSWWTMASYLNNLVYLNSEGTAIIDVVGLFPVQPNYPYTVSSDVSTITSLAIDGSEKRRKKGRERRIFNLQFTERPYAEYKLLADFWKAHEKHQRFVFQDLILEQSYVVRFDAPLNTNIRSADTVDIQATLKEV